MLGDFVHSKWLTLTLLTLVAGGYWSMGCGASNSIDNAAATQTTDVGVAQFSFKGGASISAKAHSRYPTSDATTKSVIYSGSYGVGDGELNGATIVTSCSFSLPLDTYGIQTTGTGVQVVPHGHMSDCSDPGKCIVCSMDQTESDCMVNCSGSVPTNSDTAADGFDIYVSYTTVIRTKQDQVSGMVRVDALATDWPEFDLSIQPGNPGGFSVDNSGCDGTPGNNELTLGFSPPAFGSLNAHQLGAGFDITAIDPVADSGSPYYQSSYCNIVFGFPAHMPFTGADTGTHIVSLTRGNLDFVAELCDTQSADANNTDCPHPVSWPDLP